MGILLEIASRFHSKGRRTGEVRSWWDARPELDKAVAGIEADAIERGMDADQIRARTKSYLLMSGIDLPCPIEEFLTNWIL